MASVMRIIDANANRAREALRVMEEAARFVLGDGELVREIKGIRHGLREALEHMPAEAGTPVAWRDTPGDVGTGVKGSGEHNRAGIAEVAIAAGKRLSEALRAMEEFGKVLAGTNTPAEAGPPAFAGRIERLRYRGYETERRLNLALASGSADAPWRWTLCVLVSESLCPSGDWCGVVERAIAGGADCVQLREKTLDAGELLVRARKLVAMCRPKGVSVIVNDRPDVALLAGADGVHVGQTDLPVTEVRKIVGRQLLVGVSTSRLEEAERALADGADYCGVGPMFPTTTKKKDVIVGAEYLERYVAWGRLPHLAIGGITPANMGELAAAAPGLRAVAVSSCVCGADDPEGVSRAIVEVLRGRRGEHATATEVAVPRR